MISEIQTITRFLASVSALDTGAGAKEEDVAEYYTTQYVYPVRDAFDETGDFCISTDLARQEKTQLYLRTLGKEFLDLSDKKEKVFILEPNRRQKEFLSREVFLVSSMLDLVKKILYNFRRGPNGELWLSKEEALKVSDQNFLRFLIQLDILIEKKETIELSSQYVGFLEGVVADTMMVVTPEAFEKSEAAKKEIASIAEEYVLQNECNRLSGIGAADQSK